jgi:hypothetical protein
MKMFVKTLSASARNAAVSAVIFGLSMAIVTVFRSTQVVRKLSKNELLMNNLITNLILFQ